MVHQDAGAQRNCIPGVDGAVGPHLQGQLVIVGEITHTGVLNGIVDLLDRSVDGVHRDQADDRLGRLVPVGRDIAPAVGQRQLHVEGGIGAQGGDVVVGIQDLHLAVSLDIAGSDLALAVHLNVDGLHALGVKLGDDALHVEDDLSHVFLDAGDSGELMLDACDLDGGHSRTGQRREQDPAQGVSQRSAIAALQRLHHVFAIGAVARVFHAFDARLFDFYHESVTLLVAAADGLAPPYRH